MSAWWIVEDRICFAAFLPTPSQAHSFERAISHLWLSGVDLLFSWSLNTTIKKLFRVFHVVLIVNSVTTVVVAITTTESGSLIIYHHVHEYRI